MHFLTHPNLHISAMVITDWERSALVSVWLDQHRSALINGLVHVIPMSRVLPFPIGKINLNI